MEHIEKLIGELSLENNIRLEDIPDIDLYMDQVIQLFENKLCSTKRDEEDKILTKTMINNYSKGKLLMNIKNKKYTKNHIILMSLIYELKGSLSIPDIKVILDPIVKSFDCEEEESFQLDELYRSYLDIISGNESDFKDDVLKKIDELKGIDEYESKVLLLCYLVNKGNIYRRMSEKIIDNLLK